MPVIDFHCAILAYNDSEDSTTNPQRRFADWQRHIVGIACENPLSRAYEIPPAASLTVFSGTRTLTADGTTAYGLTLNPAFPGTYRMTNTAGTAPGFRTKRSYDPNGIALTLSINNNATLTITQGSGNFNAQVGDNLWIPGVSTGDTPGPFNILNEGMWVVVAATALSVTLIRPAGTLFQGAAQTVTPGTTGTLKIFSSAGVQVGDNMEISAGFSVVTQGSYIISQVTDNWVEFMSTLSLPLESGIIPGAPGVVIYSDSKNFLCVEVDQPAVVQLNGDTGNSNRLVPLVPADENNVASFIKRGVCWQLVIVNRSQTATLNATVLSAE